MIKMRVFIELPTWLGDAVMASMAIENLCENLKDVKIVFFGSYGSIELYKSHRNGVEFIVDESKNSKFRLLSLSKNFTSFGKFDLAFSFRSSFSTKFSFKFLNAKQKFIFNKNNKQTHQAEKYSAFIANSLGFKPKFNSLKLYFEPQNFKRKTLGINPGASYGAAKRWYPSYFAEVTTSLSKEYDIIIFGGKGELKICNEIAEILAKNGVEFKNLCGKTTIKELSEHIAGLTLFITNDSGPMHIAAAYKIPTIALFGPTKWLETSPYKNPNAKIVKLDLECMPCMKRTCPLKTHECMKNLTPDIVLDAYYELKAKSTA
ncbi:MAG: lipopolysaccharide heptosyltransferase II [Campylobacter sp.]|nr:lipopolysaccharide heptosyltransferase II [Campylobacter sp.]